MTTLLNTSFDQNSLFSCLYTFMITCLCMLNVHFDWSSSKYDFCGQHQSISRWLRFYSIRGSVQVWLWNQDKTSMWLHWRVLGQKVKLSWRFPSQLKGWYGTQLLNHLTTWKKASKHMVVKKHQIHNASLCCNSNSLQIIVPAMLWLHPWFFILIITSNSL